MKKIYFTSIAIICTAIMLSCNTPQKSITSSSDAGTYNPLQYLKQFPEAKKGYTRYTIILPDKSRKDEAHYKLEIIGGKQMMTDCNHYGLQGSFTEKNLEGWGYTYYEFITDGAVSSTMMGCPDGEKKRSFVTAPGIIMDYNSRIPVVVYVPVGYEIRYRIWNGGDIMKATAR